VFFQEDVVFLQEVPHRGFDFAERECRPNFEPHNDALVSFFSHGCSEDEIERRFLFRKVFNIDDVLLGCVKENASVRAGDFCQEFLKDEWSIGRRFF
jgi:hypothetical protein